MQFEPPLGDTFHAYHDATGDLVQWIASTARATGTVGDLFDKDVPKEPRSFLQRLKDKHAGSLSRIRKLKGKIRGSKPTNITASPSTLELSYKNLKRLGEVIATAKDIEMPYSVLVVLKGIIHARKGFAT
ncbi:hypothetical protein M3J09_005948 [Ascochyta lentis]